MYLHEHDDARNGAPEKTFDPINKDDLAAILIAARFALEIERARLIVALAGIGSGVQR
jgi:hypothetical protein